MKILRHLVIFAFAAFIVVSCKKSEVKPHKSCGEKSQSQTETTATPADMNQGIENNSGNTSARSSVVEGNPLSEAPQESAFSNGDPNGDPADVSGSGDDDRDGGERKRKR